MAAATRRGIPVVVTPDAGSIAVAEGAFALLLALAKRLRELDGLVRSGRFAERDRTVVAEFAGATLGVVGMGRIGRRAAALGTAFGMCVLAADPVLGDERLSELGTEPVTLPELFDRADHIALHAPLVPGTRGMITADLLMSAGPGAFLVNLARGGPHRVARCPRCGARRRCSGRGWARRVRSRAARPEPSPLQRPEGAALAACARPFGQVSRAHLRRHGPGREGGAGGSASGGGRQPRGVRPGSGDAPVTRTASDGSPWRRSGEWRFGQRSLSFRRRPESSSGGCRRSCRE